MNPIKNGSKKMLINQSDLGSIKKNKVTLVKNFVSLERNYDFNFISDLMEENNIIIQQKSSIGN